MSDDEEFMRLIQEQFDKIVYSKPLTLEEKKRKRLIQERKDKVKKELGLDQNAQGTTTNELNE